MASLSPNLLFGDLIDLISSPMTQNEFESKLFSETPRAQEGMCQCTSPTIQHRLTVLQPFWLVIQSILTFEMKLFRSYKCNARKGQKTWWQKRVTWAAVFSLTWTFLFNFTLSKYFNSFLPFQTGPKWFLPWLPIKCQKTLPNHFPGGKFAPTK